MKLNMVILFPPTVLGLAPDFDRADHWLKPSNVTPGRFATPAKPRIVGYQSDICINPLYTEPGFPGARGPLMKPATLVPNSNYEKKNNAKLKSQ
jgi:hypothetical protein